MKIIILNIKYLLKIKIFLFSIFVLSSFISCEDLFQYSPYDANVPETNLNEKNIQRIRPINHSDTLWFIVLADVHQWYDELLEATEKINTLKNISFVVVCGDITDEGLYKEFEWYNLAMKNLTIPYITIIGNHDYRSNGSEIYKKMFGSTNFTFDIAQYHFIGFDDVVWENNNTFPDFDWLNANLCDTSRTIQVVFSHIPPWTDQLDLNYTELEQLITKKPKNVLVIQGHEHDSTKNVLHAYHIVTGCINDKKMCLVGLCDSSYTIKQINF